MYERKVLMGFIRAHILHHAVSEDGIYGAWMMDELREHGYEISPGTLYPILHEMERDGVLGSRRINVGGKIRKVYRATDEGIVVLKRLKKFISELSREVIG
ncbi:MAG: PadR family transcriptional regulator [Thermoplasmatota archaeon]